jgi:hypothetical protein
MARHLGCLPPLQYITWIYIVTSRDFIDFWGIFFTFVLLEMIGISQGFKTF